MTFTEKEKTAKARICEILEAIEILSRTNDGVTVTDIKRKLKGKDIKKSFPELYYYLKIIEEKKLIAWDIIKNVRVPRYENIRIANLEWRKEIE
jgi:hypothetical protein